MDEMPMPNPGVRLTRLDKDAQGCSRCGKSRTTVAVMHGDPYCSSKCARQDYGVALLETTSALDKSRNSYGSRSHRYVPGTRLARERWELSEEIKARELAAVARLQRVLHELAAEREAVAA